MKKTLKIGLFGFGCVGQGLYDVLNKTNGIKAEIVQVCVKDRKKKRTLDASLITYDKNDLLSDKNIDIIVELIDDADEAFTIVKTAFEQGKGVVSANKKMIAEHFEELLELQRKYELPFLYEASSCASIPIIRNIEEYYDNDLLSGIAGVFNGSTNYILSKMYNTNADYGVVLKEAQDIGFAESNPDLDVKGFDAKYKLGIIINHAFGLNVAPEDILTLGIQNINFGDIEYAKQQGYKIKLVAQAKRIDDRLVATVIPQFVDAEDKLYLVENEYNAVVLQGAFSDEQFFLGKGAGAYPTGSAVLSDISALTYDYKYEYKKREQIRTLKHSNDVTVEAYVRYNDISDLEDVKFNSVKVNHRSEGFNYVIGRLPFTELFKLSASDKPVFVSLTTQSDIQIDAKQTEEITELNTLLAEV